MLLDHAAAALGGINGPERNSTSSCNSQRAVASNDMKSARQHVVFSSTPSSLSRGHPSFPPSFPPSCITQIRGCAATRSKSVTSIERALSEGKRFKSSERKEMVCVNTQGAPLHLAVQKSAGLDRIRYTASYSFETAIHHAVRLLFQRQ